MVHYAGFASPTKRSHRDAKEIFDVGEPRHFSPPAPVANGVHEAGDSEATKCRPRSVRGSKARPGIVIIVVVLLQGRDVNLGTHISGRVALSQQRRNAGNGGGHIPVRRPHRRFRGRDGCCAGMRYQGIGRKRSGRPDDLGAFRRHQRPRLRRGSRKQWPTIHAPAVHYANRNQARGVRPGHKTLPEENCRWTGRVSAGGLVALLAVEFRSIGGKMSADLCGNDIEAAHYRWGYVTAAVAAGVGQSQGKEIRGGSTLRSGVYGTGGTNAIRDRQLACHHRLLQPLRRRGKDRSAWGDGQLRVGTHAVSGQVLWCESSECFSSDGLRGCQDDSLLHRGL